MASTINLPVTYQGQNMEFAFRLVESRRQHIFSVYVENVEVLYQWKSDGRYSASIAGSDLAAHKKIPEYGLLETINDALCSLQHMN